MADLLLRLLGEDGVSGPMGSAAGAFKVLAGAAKDCIKEFEAQERADRQLRREAGELTEAFKKQASAMQEQLGVSDDMVQRMQTMLLRFGEAPDQVEATTRALLDYSAATGTDALTATKQLLTSVESGKTAFKELGLTYEKTGRASADLGNITAALAQKVGGSAELEADSLTGSARKAEQALGEMKEAVGGLISEFINKTGAVGTFTEAIRDLQNLLFGNKESEAHFDALAKAQTNLLIATENLTDEQNRLLDLQVSGAPAKAIEAQRRQVEDFELAVYKAEQAYARLFHGEKDALPGLKGADRTTAKGRSMKSGGDKDALAELLGVEPDAQVQAYREHMLELQSVAEEAHAKKLEMIEAHDNETIALELEDQAELAKTMRALREQETQEIETTLKHQRAVMEKESKKTVEMMTQAGMAIGRALTSAINSALEDALAGQEVDVLGTAMDVAFAIGSILGQALGTYFGGPVVGAAIGQAVGGVGQIAHTLRADAWKTEQGYKKGKFHDGGWPRAHSGMWPGLSSEEQGIVTQSGERVLSRQEVGRMGGPRGVDAAAAGGGRGVTIVIPSMDSRNVREFMEGSGSRGIYNAVKTGRGNLAAMLKR